MLLFLFILKTYKLNQNTYILNVNLEEINTIVKYNLGATIWRKSLNF